MSAEKDQDYFCDGVAEEISEALSQISGLRVAARTSAFQFKGQNQDVRNIGRRLNVDTLLEGSVRKAGDRLRVTAQLVNAADGYHLWSETYERSAHDVFSIQDEISQGIVNALKPRLAVQTGSPVLKHYTRDPEAYSLYLKGRYRSERNKEWAEKAIVYFRQAVAKDQNFAPAWAGLAEAHVSLAVNAEARPADMLPKARQAAERAIQIDDGLPDAHIFLGYTNWLENWDWQGAEREFKRAVELSPSSEEARIGYARWLSYAGRADAAIEQIEQLQTNQRLTVRAAEVQVNIIFFARQYDRTIEVCRRMLASNPQGRTLHYWLGRAYAEKSMLPEAIAELETSRNSTSSSGHGFGMIGNLCARAGRKSDALKLLDTALRRSAERYVSPMSVAHLYIGLGDHDKALTWLEKGYADRDMSMTTLKVEPAFDVLRANPRFQSLLVRLHAP